MLQVTSDKLNLRNTPFADPTYANWVGDMNKGEEFSPIKIVEGVEYNGNKYWYQDTYNRYTSLVGLEDKDPKIPWSLRVLGIPHVWNITKGEGVKVAIIDSGIDLNNKDLSDALPLANRYNVLDGSANVQDNYFHGNYCASILASRGNNGLLGVAPGCELIIIKIANSNSDYTDDKTLPGIKKAMEMNADIISISFGNTQPNSEITALINQAMLSGRICIASTGNLEEDHVRYPANYKGMISVGNVSCINHSAKLGEGIFAISSDTNSGIPNSQEEGVTIVAPGDGVSAYHIGGEIWSPISGSSYSTPYVAGIAALWLSLIKRKEAKNTNYHKRFRDFIISNANKNFNGYNPPYWGSGVINPISILSI